MSYLDKLPAHSNNMYPHYLECKHECFNVNGYKHFLKIYIDPVTRINAGEWVAFGFGPYSYCSSSYTFLSQCSHYSSSIRTNPSYCNIKKDTVELQCYVNTSKLFITYT